MHPETHPTPAWRRGRALAAGLACALLAAPALAYEAKTAAPGVINDPAVGYDKLWHEVLIDITVIGVAFALVMAWFLVKYRQKKPGDVGTAPKLSTAAMVGWAVIPIFLFLSDDLFLAANGWKLWNDYRDVPADRLEVKLESGMYSWDYTYPNGVQSQNVLRVPVGKPVMLRMTSRDTLHSHFIPDFRVKEDSMPGRITYLWFYPKAPGEHIVTCAEYCGVMHGYMAGKLIVLPEADYKAWMDAEAAKQPAAAKPA